MLRLGGGAERQEKWRMVEAPVRVFLKTVLLE